MSEGGRRRRYGGATAISTLSSTVVGTDSTSDMDDIINAMDDDDLFTTMEAKQEPVAAAVSSSTSSVTIESVVSRPKGKGKLKGKRNIRKSGVVGKNQRKRQREAEKLAKRKRVVDELKVNFNELPFEDCVEEIERQTVRHCESIRSVGHDLDHLVGEAGQTGVLAQSVVDKMEIIFLVSLLSKIRF